MSDPVFRSPDLRSRSVFARHAPYRGSALDDALVSSADVGEMGVDEQGRLDDQAQKSFVLEVDGEAQAQTKRICVQKKGRIG